MFYLIFYYLAFFLRHAITNTAPEIPNIKESYPFQYHFSYLYEKSKITKFGSFFMILVYWFCYKRNFIILKQEGKLLTFPFFWFIQY